MNIDDNDDNMTNSSSTIQDVMRERAQRLRGQNQMRSNVASSLESPLSSQPAWSDPTQRYDAFINRHNRVWVPVIENPSRDISFEVCKELFPTISDIYHFMSHTKEYDDAQLKNVARYIILILNSGTLCRVMDHCKNGSKTKTRTFDNVEETKDNDVNNLTNSMKKFKVSDESFLPTQTTATRSRDDWAPNDNDIKKSTNEWRNVKRKLSKFY